MNVFSTWILYSVLNGYYILNKTRNYEEKCLGCVSYKCWRICKIYIIIIIIKYKPKYNKSMKSYQLVSFYSNHICFSCLVLGARLASTHFMFIFWTMWLGVGASLLNLEQTLPERRLQKLHLFTVCCALQIGRVKHVLKPVAYSCIISKIRCLGPD